MKLIIRSKIVFLTILIFFSSSCNDWLNLQPENDLVAQEFWKRKADVDAVMAAMYDSYRETSMESLIWGELRADMFQFNSINFNDYAQIAAVNISQSNGAINWSKYYSTINLANTILQFSEKVTELDKSFTSEIKLAYDAEAIFIRSLSYFYLTRLWKEIPYITTAASSDTVDFHIPKSSEHAVLLDVINDLKYAESIAYSNKNEHSHETFKGRANIYSIQALLADLYLWSENYQMCNEYCDKIIDSNKFSLLPKDNYFELYYPGNSRESIFEIQYDARYSDEVNPMYRNMIKLALPFAQSQGVYATEITKELFANTEDIRGGEVPRKGYFSIWKYIGLDRTTSRTASQNDANIIYYRLADILLMKAEALAELGNFNESNQIINQIKMRAGISTVILGSDIVDIREEILNERGREFGMEGKRWFDYLRFAKKNNFENKALIMNMILEGADVKTWPVLQSKILDTMSYYLPIPESEIETNPNLLQNSYYTR